MHGHYIPVKGMPCDVYFQIDVRRAFRVAFSITFWNKGCVTEDHAHLLKLG